MSESSSRRPSSRASGEGALGEEAEGRLRSRLSLFGQTPPTKNYFPRSAVRRVFVVLTDGETRPLEFPAEFADAFRREPRIQTVFVRLWGADERIYETGVAEVGYRPDPGSAEMLTQIASMEGRVLSEDESGELPQVVSDLLGTGPTIDREHEGRRRALMPYVTLAVLLPLGFVLLRRNL